MSRANNLNIIKSAYKKIKTPRSRIIALGLRSRLGGGALQSCVPSKQTLGWAAKSRSHASKTPAPRFHKRCRGKTYQRSEACPNLGYFSTANLLLNYQRSPCISSWNPWTSGMYAPSVRRVAASSRSPFKSHKMLTAYLSFTSASTLFCTSWKNPRPTRNWPMD